MGFREILVTLKEMLLFLHCKLMILFERLYYSEHNFYFSNMYEYVRKPLYGFLKTSLKNWSFSNENNFSMVI
jgi:hypothetical protein